MVASEVAIEVKIELGDLDFICVTMYFLPISASLSQYVPPLAT